MADSVDTTIAKLATRQRGYVKRAQLLALGLGAKAVDYRVRSGRLIRVHSGTYAVGHLPQHPLDEAYGALLACGPNAVLSHGTAATVYGVYRRWELPLEVTVPAARRPNRIRIHRAKLTRDDITIQLGLRVTSPARTLLDMAPRLTDKQLRRAFNQLRLSHGLRPGQLAGLLRRFPRAPGAGRLIPLAGSTSRATRSGLEDKFLDFCGRHGLPEPRLNEKLGGIEVDVFFEGEGLIVEVDGYDTHSGPVSFETDRERDASMLELGFPTVRVTEERIDNAPEREAARLRAILERRRAA